jgi:hypothetical protein
MARGISGRRQHDSNRIDNEGADCRVQCPEMRFEEPYLQHHDRKQREQNETRGLPHILLLSGYWVVVAPSRRAAPGSPGSRRAKATRHMRLGGRNPPVCGLVNFFVVQNC